MAVSGLDLGGEIESNLPSPRTDQTVKSWYYSGALDSSTRYTVPAGKTLYISDIICSNTAGSSYLYVKKNAVIMVFSRALAGDTTIIKLTTPLVYIAGDALVLSQHTRAQSSIIGWEE